MFHRILPVLLVLIVPSLAYAEEPRFDYHKKGDVGAFRLSLPASWGNPRLAGLWVVPADDSAWMIWRDLAVEEGGEKSPRAVFLGRFQGTGKHEFRFVKRDGKGGREEVRFDATYPDRDVEAPGVLRDWAEAGARTARYQASASGSDGFLAYLAWSWTTRFGEKGAEPWHEDFREREPPDMLSVFTGLYAVQESIQLAALSQPSSFAPGEATVPIAKLEGPDIQSHPFKTMIGKAKPIVEDLASWVPAHRYYVRVAGVTRLLDLLHTADDWLTHFVRNLSESSHDSRVVPRTLLQLGLTEERLSAASFANPVKELAVIGADPYFREGTAVCAILVPSDAGALRKALDESWAAVASSVPGAVEVASEKGFRGLVSPDRSVNAWLAGSGDVVVLCSSLALAKEVLAAKDGRAPSLARSDDFRYMRTILPAGPDEDAFLFLSDAHVRHLVGPRAKLGERRRLICTSGMQSIQHAADLYRMELRKSPAGIDELTSAGFLPKEGLACPDHGKHTLDPKTLTVSCSVHGRIGSLVPVDEVPLDKVTVAEMEEYQRFVADYHTYWRQYFDPVGVRLGLKDGLTIDTIILPLIDNSVYNGLKEVTDGATAPVGAYVVPKKTIFHAQVALSPKVRADVLGELDRMYREPGAKKSPGLSEAVGTDVTFGLYDRDLLFDFDVPQFFNFGLRQRMGVEGMVLLPIIASLNLPVWMSVSVKDPERLDRLLTAFRGFVDSEVRRDWRREFDRWSADFYDLPAYKGVSIHVFGIKILGLLKWRVFYARVGDRLYAASKDYVLRDIVDAFVEGKRDRPGEPATAAFTLDPRAFDRILTDLHLGWAEHARTACQNNQSGLWAALLATGGKDVAKAQQWSADRRGLRFFCPDQGAYTVEPDSGQVTCSVHGGRWEAKQEAEPRTLARSKRFLDRLGPASVFLTFTPEGLKTRISLKFLEK
jgi:hypothetical protein